MEYLFLQLNISRIFCKFLHIYIKRYDESVSCALQPYGLQLQATLSTEFSRQEYWSLQPFPSPGYLPSPEMGPWSPALQAHFYCLSHQVSLYINIVHIFQDVFPKRAILAQRYIHQSILLNIFKILTIFCHIDFQELAPIQAFIFIMGKYQSVATCQY